MEDISTLRGLGPKSARMLTAVGIKSKEQLEEIGPVRAYLMVRDQSEFNPGKNLLYAMVGALEDRDWTSVANEDRYSLMMALDGIEKLQDLFGDEAI